MRCVDLVTFVVLIELVTQRNITRGAEINRFRSSQSSSSSSFLFFFFFFFTQNEILTLLICKEWGMRVRGKSERLAH